MDRKSLIYGEASKNVDEDGEYIDGVDDTLLNKTMVHSKHLTFFPHIT